MDGNSALLNIIYQNSQLGAYAAQHLTKQLDGAKVDGGFKNYLKYQYDQYTDITNSAKQLLEKNGLDGKDVSRFDRARARVILDIQTLANKTPSRISELLIIGNNLSIIDAVKNSKRYSSAGPDARDLMGKLQRFNESSMQDLKSFLS